MIIYEDSHNWSSAVIRIFWFSQPTLFKWRPSLVASNHVVRLVCSSILEECIASIFQVTQLD